MVQMRMLKGFVFFVLFLFFSSTFAQSIKGIVLDAQTNEPIESVAVYFDNTTIGTSTNDKGEFEIEPKEGVTSALVFSFLGYEKVILDTYNSKQFYKVFLKESAESLDEVVISTDDGMPKKVKLHQFTEQFLGFSKFAKSCKILNKEALILRYDQDSKQLTASAKEPIVVLNNDLKYKVNFDIIDFVIDYKYVDVLRNQYVVNSMFYSGTSFFEPIENRDVKQTKKKREIAYKGSALHFMRALSQKKLKEEKYAIYSNGFRVDPDKYIYVEKVDSTQSYNIKLRAPLSVLYKRKLQSEIELPPNINGQPKMAKLNSSEIKNGHISINASKRLIEEPYFNVAFVIDYYGNYSPIGTFYFIGHMGNQRVGDSLPFDYELSED
jgi:hypothetical protein